MSSFLVCSFSVGKPSSRVLTHSHLRLEYFNPLASVKDTTFFACSLVMVARAKAAQERRCAGSQGLKQLVSQPDHNVPNIWYNEEERDLKAD